MTDTFTGRKNHGRGHSYYIDGQKVMGVTTILSQGLPKPALVNWAASQAAGYAVDNWDDLAALPPSERLKRISKAHEASRNAAAARGTRIHALAEPLSRGEQVHVPDELAGHVESCVRFLDEWDVEPMLTEAPVLSRRWGYGGTLDLGAKLRGIPGLWDFKTSASGAYGDTAFQLAAYAFADFTVGEDGREIPLPSFGEFGVIWLRADGYSVYPYQVDERIFRQFLYIQQVAMAAGECRDLKGDELMPPVRAS